MRLPRPLIRIVFTSLHGLRRLLWAVTGPNRDGVHAMPLTPEGRLVLVRLTYAPGWRLPGGGRKRRETQEEAMLRELREEIGLLSHGAVERLGDLFLGDGSALFVVRDVVYRPRRSLEVEAVGEFDPDRLPDDAAGWTVQVLERWASPRPAQGRAGG